MTPALSSLLLTLPASLLVGGILATCIRSLPMHADTVDLIPSVGSALALCMAISSCLLSLTIRSIR